MPAGGWPSRSRSSGHDGADRRDRPGAQQRSHERGGAVAGVRRPGRLALGDPDHEHEPRLQIVEQRVGCGLRVGVALLEAAQDRERVLAAAGEREPADPVAAPVFVDSDAIEAAQHRGVLVIANGDDAEIDLAAVRAGGAARSLGDPVDRG
jgi:hypothetical protein